MHITDQMGRKVLVEAEPQRIISLVPSQTELLHALGLEDRVVGITKFCIHPDTWFRTKVRVGGTKSVNFERIASLSPDLIIGNKEENERSDIEALEQEYPVFMSDIFSLPDALEMIKLVGEATGTAEKANALANEIRAAFEELRIWVAENMNPSKKVAYLIWRNPDFMAGKNTFIDAMLEYCGLENVTHMERYPEFTTEEKNQPDLILLSSEPYPFQDSHLKEFQDKYPNATIKLVDGEMFSWYGSRLLKAPSYFKSLLKELAAN